MAHSKGDISWKALRFGDVIIKEGQASIKIHSFKTDQRGKGRVLTLGPCSDRDLCPVLALTKFMVNRGMLAGYFFIHLDGLPVGHVQGLGYFGSAWVKFGTHSFRIGAASTASSMGYSKEQIQNLEQWRSGVYRTYVRNLKF